MLDLDATLRLLRTVGFAVLPARPLDLREPYDRAVAAADARDVSRKDSTRVHDFVNRGPEFDLWRDPLLLAICERAFAQPFKLSSYLARTVNPGAAAQTLHVDWDSETGKRGELALLGFIWMIDAFARDNGATRFSPPGHATPLVATGAIGSLLVYDGAILHGHGANHTTAPRRSLQGAFILRTLRQGHDQRALLRADTAARLDARARYLLAVEP